MRITPSTTLRSAAMSPEELRSAPVPPLRDDDHVRGPAGAPIVALYADFTCPRCILLAHRLRGAPLRVAFRHFALRARHPRAVALAHAAEAAGAQGAFWPMHDALYDDAGRIDDPHLWERCAALGLDVDRFDADRRSDVVAERVARDVRDALRAGATATPTAYVWDAVAAATMTGFGIRDVRETGLPADGWAEKEGPRHDEQ
jgi:protein-disulfide isomerase